MKGPALLHILITVTCLCWHVTLSSSKRVMFMPAPISSHAIAHMTLARAVADQGHEVVLVLSSQAVDTLKLKSRYSGAKCSDRRGVRMTDHCSRADQADKKQMHVIEYSAVSFDDDVVYPGILQPLLEGKGKNVDFIFKMLLKMNGDILANKTLFEEMKAFRPDLFVFDDEPLGARMFAIFPYKMQVPFAAVDFIYDPNTKRVPFSPAVTPRFVLPFNPLMDSKRKMENIFVILRSLALDLFCENDAVARYAPEMPYVSVYQLLTRAEIWLVQSDHILDYPKPTLPNVKMVGYLAASPGEPLPGEFQTFMDKAEDGVVIVSLGSLALSLTDWWGEWVLMEVFKNLGKLKVIFASKVRSPDPERIMTSQWIPLNDLLAHPNTRVLVTHCGMGSQYQALYHAVPMVGIPFFYDQFYNAERLRAGGFGRVSQLMSSQLVEAILDVATNPWYRQNIQQASVLYRMFYGESAKEAAFWLDHVMHYGGGHLKSADQMIPLEEFLLLDALAVFVLVVVIVVAVSVCLCTCTCCLACRLICRCARSLL